MNPTRLQATNYRSFHDLDLELAQGVTAVIGHNGAGKSSIVNLIDLALFGPQSRTLADLVTDDQDGDLELTLTFEHAGETYRVRRGFSPRGRGKTTLDFETAGPHPIYATWKSLTQGSAKDTQAEIERVLGLTRKTWRASAFLAQGDGAAFTDADPRDRKAILAEVLALDVWEELRTLAAADRATAERGLAEIDGETSVLRDQAAQREVAEFQKAAAEREESDASVALTAAESEVAEVAEQVRDAETSAATRAAAEATLAAARADHVRLQQTKQEAADASTAKAATLEEIAGLATVDQVVALEQEAQALRDRKAAETLALAEHDAKVRERALKVSQQDAIRAQAEELRARASDLREKADKLEAQGAGENTCDHCGQTLGVEALAASLLKLRGEADDLTAAAVERAEQALAFQIPPVEEPPATDATLEEQFAKVTADLGKARGDQEQRAQLTERVRSLDEKIAAANAPDFGKALLAAELAVDAAESALEALPPAADVHALHGRVLLFQGRVTDARGKLDEARRRKAIADHALEQVAAAEAKLAETAERREEFQQEVDLASALEKAYGRDGIPALIVESQAIPMIEVDANRILQDLGTSYRVELRTQRELKSGDGLRDTLDVVVIGDAGARAYETFSGGERTRINLALRIALAKLLAHRKGAESRLLAIDEPDGLDADGFARLAEVLHGESATFDRVLVISHHPDLAGAFDSTLEVVKVDGRSRVAA